MSGPLWVRLAAALTQRLPRGRYRALQWWSRLSAPAPFLARTSRRLGRFRWVCDLRDAIAREVCFTGSYEPPETALVLALLDPGATFVDVGANWGYFTLVAAGRLGPGGRVVSLEPDPRLCRALEQNVALNRLTGIRILPVAAHERDQQMALIGYRETEGNFGISRLAHGAELGATHTVEARPLDDLLDELNVATVDLMKMDIEGAEGFALRGLRRSLAAGRVRRVLLELHPHELSSYGETVEAAVRPLREAGLDPWRIDHSPTAYRGALHLRGNIAQLLAPWDGHRPLGAWPHLLWTLPGERPVP